MQVHIKKLEKVVTRQRDFHMIPNNIALYHLLSLTPHFRTTSMLNSVNNLRTSSRTLIKCSRTITLPRKLHLPNLLLHSFPWIPNVRSSQLEADEPSVYQGIPISPLHPLSHGSSDLGWANFKFLLTSVVIWDTLDSFFLPPSNPEGSSESQL